MKLVLTFLFFGSIVISQASTIEGPSVVACTATAGYHCANSEDGCRPDRTYSVTFTIDRDAGTVTDSDGNAFRILPVPSVEISGKLFEYAIQAIAQVGAAATVTIVIGEKSFVSSNVSVAPPRAYVQVGTCSGLKRP